MKKRDRYFQRIEEYKERFQELPTEIIRKRLSFGNLYKEASIAYREVLEERGEKLDKL